MGLKFVDFIDLHFYIFQYAKSKLQEIEDGNVAVWRKGLEKAFDLLRKVKNQGVIKLFFELM